MLVCSDGLWNYASEPAALRAQVRRRPVARPTRRTSRSRLVAVGQRAGGPGQHHGGAGPGSGHNGRSTEVREGAMAEFTAAVYQNEFLPDGGTDVNAIVSVTCAGAGTAGQGRRRMTPARSSSSTPPARWGTARWPRRSAAQAALAADRRRHLVRGRLRQRRPPSSPTRTSRPAPGWCGWTRGPGPRPATRSPRLRSGRWHGDRHLARPRRWSCSARCPRSSSGTPSCSPTARTTSPRTSSTPPSPAATGALPVPTAAAVGVDWKVERGAPDRPGAARHRRHHPHARPDGRPSSRR